MTKKAVVFGAGNIGRGLLTWILHKSGYKTTFVDTSPKVIGLINEHGSYPVHEVSATGTHSSWVHDVSGMLVHDEGVIAEIAQADLVMTAVGKGALPAVSSLLAQALLFRARKGHKKPMGAVVIACENMQENTAFLKKCILKEIPEDMHTKLLGLVSFPNCAVDRIVPASVGAPDHPLAVTTELYYQLAVDATALHDPLSLDGVVFTDDLDAVLQQKLFTLNMAHTLCAYLGLAGGMDYVHEAVSDPHIRRILDGAFGEVSQLLTTKFPSISPANQQEYVNSVLSRFANSFLQDRLDRVGRDPLRKLSAGERFVDPATQSCGIGVVPTFLSSGIAAAMHFDSPADQQAVELQHILQEQPFSAALEQISGIAPDSDLHHMVTSHYSLRAL